MKGPIFKYSIKVWLTTSIVAPLLISFLRFISLRNYLLSINCHDQCAIPLYHGFLKKQFGFLIGSIIVLIPLGIVVYYTIIFLKKRQVSFLIYKRYLSILGVSVSLFPGLLLLSYSTISNIESFYNLKMFEADGIFYGLAALASILLYRLKLNTIPNEQ
ncbi:MAG: hypothetical protein JWP44_895 [Mucilaginibacter sp.]|nr:hypothetical protein [Mucilaginibacter sp.]